MRHVLVVSHLIISLQLILTNCENSQVWDTKEEFFNRLPATLAAIFSVTTQTSGECLMYCLMKNCSSVAYSETSQSCKLYSHPNLAKPLPKLALDSTGLQHRMYYKKLYCPAGWEADYITGKCYFMDTLAQLRPAAWQVCEEHLVSEMVTFQLALQRDNLYRILNSKYSSTPKWWSGYASFDTHLWPRPIDEIPGYRAFRGDCPGNTIGQFNVPPAQCALKCDRTYRDKCVGFVYDGNIGICYLKAKSCPGQNNGTNPLGSEYWWYEKVHAGRPYTTNVLQHASGYNIITLNGVTLDQCKRQATASLGAVLFSYISSSQTCSIHRRDVVAKNVSTANSYDMNDISDGWCPHGARYRDVCLMIIQSPSMADYYSGRSWCRSMGGKLSRPDGGKRKASYLYGPNGWAFFDYIDEGHINTWTTEYDGLTLTNAFYDRWSWNSGEPSTTNNEHCIAIAVPTADSTGTYVKMNNIPCSGFSYTGAFCELPITQSYPRDCRFTPLGREYMGRVSYTKSNVNCKAWSSTSYSGSWRLFPDWYTSINFCRSPDSGILAQPWCYRSNDSVAEACDVPMCPESDWASGQTYDQPTLPFAAITRTGTQPDSYYWTVEGITTTANAICQIDMNKWCPYYFRGSCYQLYKFPNSHSEAQAICQQNGWHLVTITSMDEQKFIMGITQSLGHQWMLIYGYHIGLQWNTSVSNWAWDTGEPYSSTPNLWQGGAPANSASGYCGFLYSLQEGWWVTKNCWFKIWFICEIELAG